MTFPKKLSRYNKLLSKNVDIHITKVNLEAAHKKISFADDIGERDTMEDAACVYYANVPGQERVMCAGVFDGHGGSLVAKQMERILCSKILNMYCQLRVTERKHRVIRSILFHVFKDTDRQLHNLYTKTKEVSGCTAIVLLVDPNTQTSYYINLGDSKGIAYKNGKLLCETIDHKPDSTKERTRIKKAGGVINKEAGDVHRINNILSLSRALGDHSKEDNLKYRGGKYTSHGPVSCVPDIYKFPLTDTGITFLLACDGIWDVLTPEKVVSKMSKGETLKGLIRHAIDDKKSGDNVTVLRIIV